jgi:hypothetical protein
MTNFIQEIHYERVVELGFAYYAKGILYEHELQLTILDQYVQYIKYYDNYEMTTTRYILSRPSWVLHQSVED